MKLYHVSYDKIESFTPRIPPETILEEDTSIPRICFSTSIVGCINAKPRRADGIKVAIENNLPFGIYVYEIDSDDYVESKELISPQTLFSSKLLPDAMQNDEYWLLVSPKEIKETRYELESAMIKSSDSPDGSVLLSSISLIEGSSKESLLLEAITKKSKDIYKGLTTDLLVYSFSPVFPSKIRKKIYNSQ